MIIQELRTGEKRYTKIQVVFEVFGLRLLKILTKYESQPNFKTNYKVVLF